MNAAYKAYVAQREKDWEFLAQYGNEGEGSGGGRKKSKPITSRSSIVRGNTGTLVQCIPYNASSNTLIGRGRHGEVRLARVVIRVDTTLSLHSRTSELLETTILTQSEGAALPVQFLFLAGVKEFQLPLSLASRGSLQGLPLLKMCHKAVKDWRRLSAQCEGLLHCIGAEVRSGSVLGVPQDSAAQSGSPRSNSFAKRGPRFRVYMELCRFGSLQQFKEIECVRRFGMARVHELTMRVMMREVLLTLLFLHREGYVQCDLSPRTIFLQHPVDLIYGSLFPHALRRDAEPAGGSPSPSSVIMKYNPFDPKPAASAYAVSSWTALTEGTREWIQAQSGGNVPSLAVDVPVMSVFADEPPAHDVELGTAAVSTAEVFGFNDTPVPPTITTHEVENSSSGGLSMLVQHKFSAPVCGYMPAGASAVSSHEKELLEINRAALRQTTAVDGKERRCSPALNNSAPPPMLVDKNGQYGVVGPSAISSARRPLFATRLQHAMRVRRLLMSDCNDSAGVQQLPPVWRYLSPNFAAPEVLMGEEPQEASDIYSWALTFISLTQESKGSASSRLSDTILPQCVPEVDSPPRTRAEILSFDEKWCEKLRSHYSARAMNERKMMVEHRQQQKLQQSASISSHHRSTSSCSGHHSGVFPPPSVPEGCIVIPVRREPRRYLTLYPVAVTLPAHLSSACRIMLLWCLQLDPERRPSASELLALPYFTSWEWITTRSIQPPSNPRMEECLPEGAWREAK